jgi:hypothetical protein
MSDFLKVAFFQGIQDALTNYGIKVAAEPGQLNPKARRRAPGLDAVEGDRAGMGLSGLDMPEARVNARSRVSNVAPGNISSSGKKRLDDLQLALSGMDTALKGGYVDLDEAPKPKPRARTAPRRSAPPKKAPMKQLFPGSDSAAFVSMMSNPMTRPNLPRQVGNDVPAPSARPAPRQAPAPNRVANPRVGPSGQGLNASMDYLLPPEGSNIPRGAGGFGVGNMSSPWQYGTQGGEKKVAPVVKKRRIVGEA